MEFSEVRLNDVFCDVDLGACADVACLRLPKGALDLGLSSVEVHQVRLLEELLHGIVVETGRVEERAPQLALLSFLLRL